jgi:hypothetical protein
MPILGSIDRLKELTRPGQLFLAAAPTADPGANNTARLTAMFQYFYTAGDTRKPLTASPWCNLSAEGVKVKVKENLVENETNESSKHPVGRQDFEVDLEFKFFDVDINHLADAIGAKTDEIITRAAATGKAGRKELLVGGQRTLQRYTLMYKTPSPNFAGEFDNFLFLRCYVGIDWELNLNKKDVVNCTLKVSLLNDPYILNADGFPELFVIDEVNAVAL